MIQLLNESMYVTTYRSVYTAVGAAGKYIIDRWSANTLFAHMLVIQKVLVAVYMYVNSPVVQCKVYL